MSVLVTGANGLLGSAISRDLENAGEKVVRLVRCVHTAQHAELSRTVACDLRDHREVVRQLKSLQIDSVVHCAAITDLLYCEQHPAVAHEVHVVATELLTDVFHDTRFLYISTDSVFDGLAGSYDEDAAPNPLNSYAKTKLEGERSVRRLYDGLVIRTNLYDIRPTGGKSLAEWAYRKLVAAEQINGFTNVVFNPLHVSQIAHIVRLLLADMKAVRGLVHLGSDINLSKYDFILRLAESLGLPRDLIRAVELHKLRDEVIRPLNTSLEIARANSLFPHDSLSFDFGLEMLTRKVASFDE